MPTHLDGDRPYSPLIKNKFINATQKCLHSVNDQTECDRALAAVTVRLTQGHFFAHNS